VEKLKFELLFGKSWTLHRPHQRGEGPSSHISFHSNIFFKEGLHFSAYISTARLHSRRGYDSPACGLELSLSEKNGLIMKCKIQQRRPRNNIPLPEGPATGLLSFQTWKDC